MLKEVLDAALTTEQKEAGLFLEEEPDVLFLLKDGRRVAIFLADMATVAEIDTASRYQQQQGWLLCVKLWKRSRIIIPTRA